MADAPPQLYGSAGYPVRKSGSQEVRGQGVRSQNFRGLDEKILRDLEYSSQDARRGAIDLFNRGMRVNPDGTVQSSSIFSKKSYGNIADVLGKPTGGGTAPTAPSPTAPRSETAARGFRDAALNAGINSAAAVGAAFSPAASFGSALSEGIKSASAALSPTATSPTSSAATMRERLRGTSAMGQTTPLPMTVERPQIMPATARDAAAGRMDVMGPGGSPTSIASKYGTASVKSYSLSPEELRAKARGEEVRPSRMPEAMTRDTFASRNVSLKDWLRERRNEQRGRGIA